MIADQLLFTQAVRLLTGENGTHNVGGEEGEWHKFFEIYSTSAMRRYTIAAT